MLIPAAALFCCGAVLPGLLQGNLLKGIVIWFVRREGREPVKSVTSLLLFSVTRFYNITKWFKKIQLVKSIHYKRHAFKIFALQESNTFVEIIEKNMVRPRI